MELFQSRLLLSLMEQKLRQRREYPTTSRLSRDPRYKINNIMSNVGSRFKFNAAVDNEFCDMIFALYDNEYNINPDDSDSDNLSMVDMISIIYDNNFHVSNGKTENDLQIQLAMLWRIIAVIKKSNKTTIKDFRCTNKMKVSSYRLKNSNMPTLLEEVLLLLLLL